MFITDNLILRSRAKRGVSKDLATMIVYPTLRDGPAGLLRVRLGALLAA
jgi:hypothetical protein